MSTDLHSMLDDIENKLNCKSSKIILLDRTTPKQLESKIKADLNYFKENKQKMYESKLLINENFLPTSSRGQELKSEVFYIINHYHGNLYSHRSSLPKAFLL